MIDLDGWLILVGGLLCWIAKVAQDRARRAQSTDGGERPVSTALWRSNRMVRTIGMALVLVGIALFVAGSFTHSWTPRIYGLLAAFLGVIFVRASFDRMLSPGTGDDEEVPKAVRRFDRVMWIIGIALVPVAAFSLASLFLYGYHAAWPLYTFVVVAVICTLVWAYLFARLMMWLTQAAGEWWGR